MRSQQRREQRPDPVKDSRAVGKADVPLDDPGYHYRIVSKEPETRERVDYHKDMGYGVAKQTNRFVVLGCKKEEHEERNRQAQERADRIKESPVARTSEVALDDLSIEVTRGPQARE